MNTKNTNIILLAFTAIAFISGIILYPKFPNLIASHWNASGEANGYMGKFWGIFLLPIIMAGLFLLYFFIPRIDPLKNNIESFRKHYNAFWIFMFAFFLYIFGLTLVWNFGFRFNFTTAIIPAMAVLFFFIGFFLERLKRNWFVGIRTPWTLSSDIVWEKTHKLGGNLFKIVALISLVGLFLRGITVVAVMVVPAIIVAIATIIYSYIEYKKQK
jgi:uncharacterized membrane protein